MENKNFEKPEAKGPELTEKEIDEILKESPFYNELTSEEKAETIERIKKFSNNKEEYKKAA